MSDLKDNKTHTSNFAGRIEEASTPPTDEGVAGLSGKGQQYYDTTDDSIGIHTGSNVWKSIVLTTTSTSTSTSTSTTTTA